MNYPQSVLPMSVKSSHSTKDEIDVRQILALIYDGRWIIIIVTVLFVMGGVLKAVFTTPIYRADALLQVEDKSSTLPGFSDMTEMFSRDTPVASEIEVLKSRSIIGKVVDDLSLTIVSRPHYLPYLGKGLIRHLSKTQLDFLALKLSDYAWDNETVLNVTQLDVDDKLVNSPLVLVAGDAGKYVLLHNDKALLSGEVGEMAQGQNVKILVTDLLTRSGVKFTVQRLPRLAVISRLQSELQAVEKRKVGGILNLTLDGKNKNLIKRILDSIAKQYVLQNVQRTSAEAEQGILFLKKHLPSVKEELTKAEELLNAYRLENESVDLSLETQSVLTQLVTIESQLNELALNEADMSRRFTKQHPQFISLLDKRSMLLKEKNNLNEQTRLLPKTQQDVLRLTRDVAVSQEIYIQLLNKKNELNIVKAGTVGNVRIIDDAVVFDDSIAPKKAQIVIFAMMFGIILGVFIILLRFAMYRGIKSPKDIESTGLPVYASIPLSTAQILGNKSNQGKRGRKNARGLLANHAPEDLAIEAVRSLRTSVHFALLEQEKNVLLIVGPGENLGKSFVSGNLAAVYAQSGHKVLLIDADMRKGYLHHALQVLNDKGLSELLSSQLEVKQVINKTNIVHLDFISAGRVPPNPSELLMRPTLKALVEWGSKEYDVVIIDTPPVLAVTDAMLIGPFASVCMLVARFEQTTIKEIELVLQRCEQNGLNIKGCIVNGIVRKASGYYGYGNYGYENYSYKAE